MADSINKLGSKIKFLELKVSILENQLTRALDLVARDPGDPESTIVKSRVILEKVTKDIYSKTGVELPKKATELGGMINNNQFTKKLPPRIVLRMNSVREFGNLGAHDKGPVSTSDAIDCLNCLVEILDWYCETYIGENYPQSKNDFLGEHPSQQHSSGTGIIKSFFQKNTKQLIIVCSCLVLLLAFIVFSFTRKASESDTLIPRFEDLISQGLNRDVQATLQVAYSTKMEGETPSAAITVLTKRGTDPTETWRPLQEGESLSSADNYRIMFCPENRAFFYVVQIDSKGKLDWLFPANSVTGFSVGQNPAPPNMWTAVPGETTGFHLDQNIGMEHLYVIVTSQRWNDFESAIEKAASANAGETSVHTAFKLKTRGAGGVRMVAVPSIAKGLEASRDIRRLITGKDGILVYEKWFQHVVSDTKRNK